MPAYGAQRSVFRDLRVHRSQFSRRNMHKLKRFQIRPWQTRQEKLRRRKSRHPNARPFKHSLDWPPSAELMDARPDALKARIRPFLAALLFPCFAGKTTSMCRLPAPSGKFNRDRIALVE